MLMLFVTLVEMSHVTVGAKKRHPPKGLGISHTVPKVQLTAPQEGLTPLELLTVHDDPGKSPPTADMVPITSPTTGRVNSSSLSTTPSRVTGVLPCTAPVDLTRPFVPKKSVFRFCPPGRLPKSTLPQQVKFVAVEMSCSPSV